MQTYLFRIDILIVLKVAIFTVLKHIECKVNKTSPILENEEAYSEMSHTLLYLRLMI